MASDWEMIRTVLLKEGYSDEGCTPVLEALSSLEAEHARQTTKYLAALEEIEAWKNATGLERGGDPDAVRPADLEKELERLRADAERLAAAEKRADNHWAIAEHVAGPRWERLSAWARERFMHDAMLAVRYVLGEPKP